ncbi:MAG: hypothetical protein KDE62_16910, partial [Calditrichaeota bacterium]|nr:hypothetical protein [Calditrichota bacterium]
FLNPEGKMVTVVMNQSDLAINYKLIAGERQTTVQALPHSIQTLVY